MHDAPNKKDDLFDMSEIEKIQAEIARDLEKTDAVEISSQPITPTTTIYPPPITNDYERVSYHAPPPPHPPRISWMKRLVIVCLICTLGTTSFGFAFGAATTWMRERNTQESPSAPTTSASSEPLTSARYTFTPVAEDGVVTLADMIHATRASVVSLTTLTEGYPMRHGTGIIFAEEAERVFIVTNHYVVALGDQVLVRFVCGALVSAHPFAHDQDMDISVIFVYKSDLEAVDVNHVVLATFGDSSAMRMGETVIALGNSRGEGISVTRGIISAEEQLLEMPSGVARNRQLDVYVLQTDASINDGDSGGPLINMRGEVVGIINASATFLLFDTGAMAEGIGYTIASNMMQSMVYQLVNRRRPAMGIEGIDLTEAEAERYDIPLAGVVIRRVMVGGAAEAAGILAGDIITGFAGKPVLDMTHLRTEIIASLDPGDIVEVRILREGEPLVLEMELQPMIFDTF